jgi:hypothetical protein
MVSFLIVLEVEMVEIKLWRRRVLHEVAQVVWP